MYTVASFLPASAPKTGPYLIIPPDELQDDIQVLRKTTFLHPTFFFERSENNPDANDEEMVEGEEVTMDSLLAGYAEDAPRNLKILRRSEFMD